MLNPRFQRQSDSYSDYNLDLDGFYDGKRTSPVNHIDHVPGRALKDAEGPAAAGSIFLVAARTLGFNDQLRMLNSSVQLASA